ncbi:MAG: transposase [Streptosporangiaceae bacterium]
MRDADRRGPVPDLATPRAHYFFSRARWQPGDLGLTLARLAVTLLVPAGQPVTVAIDDTRFRRRGKKAFI